MSVFEDRGYVEGAQVAAQGDMYVGLVVAKDLRASQVYIGFELGDQRATRSMVDQ